MRIIWYILDGLTPCMLQSFNENKQNNFQNFAPKNYIDYLSNGSFMIKNCYGYGETMASLSSIVTGRDVLALKSDMPSHVDSYHHWKTMADILKQKGFTNIFYRSFPPDGLRRNGPYRRFNSLESKGFDRVCLEDETVPFVSSKFLEKNKRYFVTKSNESAFIFIHDLCLHDHKLVRRNGTNKGLAKAIVQCAEQVASNLKYLNYKKDKDILIFSSDHGMTLAPYDDMFFNKNISKKEMESYWPKLTADFKLKTVFFIKGPNIKSGQATGVFEIRDMLATVFDFLKIKPIPLGAVSARKNRRKYAIVSVAGAPYEHALIHELINWFHPYIVYVENSDKWVYRKFIKSKCYHIDLKNDANENTPIEISFDDFPEQFKKYIHSYFSLKANLLRFFYCFNPKRYIGFIFKKVHLIPDK